jgi:hypothetical protein
MPTIRFSGFNGEVRAAHPKLLSDTACTVLKNAKPGRGDLRPWRQPEPVRDPLVVTTGDEIVLTNYIPGAVVANETTIIF